MAKGKGKGKGGKGTGKGGAKGGSTGGQPTQPAIPRNFKEGCWHCGDPGHRRQECPKYKAELAKLQAAKAAPAGGGVRELAGGDTQVSAAVAEVAWYLGQLSGQDEPEGEEGKTLGEVRISQFEHCNPFEVLRESLDGPPEALASAGSLDEAVGGMPEAQALASAGSPAQEGVPDPPTAEFSLPSAVLKRRRRAQRRARDLAILSRDGGLEPLVAPVARGPTIEVVVDSGAEDSVTPPDLFPGEVAPSSTSRAGRKYRAANGSPIPNLGQTVAHFRDPEGRMCGIPFQVAPVERPLLSVARMTEAGCTVSFGNNSGEIVHAASGRTLPLFRRNGVYVLELSPVAPEEVVRPRQRAAHFPRQG